MKQKAIIAKLLRHFLTGLGGFFVAKGVLDPEVADGFVALLTSNEALGIYSYLLGQLLSLKELRD